MKRKTTLVCAMALVIAGLLITSAAGIPTMGVTKPATKTEENIDADSCVAALLKEYGIDPATKKVVQAEKGMSVQKTVVQSEVTLVELSEETQMDISPYKTSETRDILKSHAKHPAMGDKHDGNIALGYDLDYFNSSSGETFNGLIFALSDDYGENWADTWTLVYGGTEDEYPATYPSIDYMDYNDADGGNVFYATFNELTETFWQDDPGYGIRWYNGTNVSFMRIAWDEDIDNPDVWVRTWTAFGRTTPPPPPTKFKYWHDMEMSAIAAADDFYFEVNRTWQPFGLCSFVVDIYSEDPGDPSTDNGCNWFYPIEHYIEGEWNSRYGLMWHYIDIDGARATSCDIDKTPNADTGNPEDKKAYAVWDPLSTTNPGQHIVLIASINMTVGDGMNELFHYDYGSGVWDGVSWSMVDPEYSLEYPEIAAANDGEIVIAQELVNILDPAAETMLSLWYCNSSDGNTMNMETKNYWFDYPAYYPEVSWLYDHIFMVHWIMNDKLYAAFSQDGGYTWSKNQSDWIEYYQWSDVETVKTDYRGVELSDEASISLWEYDASSPPDILITNIYYRHNWFIVDGYCKYPNDDPVNPVYMEILNTNNNQEYPPDIEDNYYSRKLLLGLDIWTDPEPALFKITGADCSDYGVVEHEFTEIYPVNTIDIIFDQTRIGGDADFDGDVDHSDLGILLSVWGKCEGDEGFNWRADFDCSGCIDHPDLGILLSNWGYVCP